MSVANLEMERADAALLQRLRDENETLGKSVEALRDIRGEYDGKFRLMGVHLNTLMEENEALRLTVARTQSKSTNRHRALRSLNIAYAYVSARLVISESRRMHLVKRIDDQGAIIDRLDTQIAANRTDLAQGSEDC